METDFLSAILQIFFFLQFPIMQTGSANFHCLGQHIYALDGLPNKVLASEYKMQLPNETALIAEIQKTQKMLELKMNVKNHR